MRALTGIVLALGLLFSTASYSSNNTMTIYNDGGGVVAEYAKKIRKFKARGGTHVRIAGKCASACILWLHNEFGLKHCATPNAKLGFHIPFKMNESKVARSQDMHKRMYEITQFIIRGLPPKLRNHWQNKELPSPSRGASVSAMSWVKSEQAQEMIGACDV